MFAIEAYPDGVDDSLILLPCTYTCWKVQLRHEHEKLTHKNRSMTEC